MKKSSHRTKKVSPGKPARTAKRPPVKSRSPMAAEAVRGVQGSKSEFSLHKWRDQQQAEQAALIAVDPWMAMCVAKERMREGFEVLSQLVDQGALARPSKGENGALNTSGDPALDAICRAFELLKHKVAQHTRNGRTECVAATWGAGLFFAELIHELAANEVTARKLERHARRSLYLPTLQARQPTFTYDFKHVADVLHLAEDCISNTAKDAQHRLATPITNLVVDIVESIGVIQVSLRAARATYQRIRAAYADPKSRAGLPPTAVALLEGTDAMTEDEYLVRHGFSAENLSYDALPPLTKATADVWWDRAVKQVVNRRLSDPGPESKRLRRLVHYLKPYEQLADLRRRCKSALCTVVRPTQQTPTPS